MAKGYSALQNWASLIGRILLSLIFIIAGFHKIMDYSGTLAMMTQAGLPSPKTLLILAIIFELGGGLLVFFGWFTRFGAFLLFVFVIAVTISFHTFWTYEAQEAANQMQHFMKNLSILGALLYVMGFGAGGYSFDRARHHKKVEKSAS